MYRTAESSLLFAAADGTVTAYARRTGTIAWQFRVPEGEGDFRHFTRLCADEKRVVIVAARMNESGFFANADGTAHVCCLDYASGRLLWEQRVKAGQNIAHFTATLLIDGAEVFLAHSDAVVAFELESGNILWQQRAERVDARHRLLPVALAVAGNAEQGDAR